MMTTLPTRPLGTTDMSITRVGFGAWAVGGGDWSFGWGPQDDADSVAAIRHSVESGINWIDTAAVYGLGHSEVVTASALRDLPENDRPFVFTKGGLVWDEADHAKDPVRIGAPESLRREVDLSLRRLGVERIDLYQMHWPPGDGTPLEDYWQAFVDLKATSPSSTRPKPSGTSTRSNRCSTRSSAPPRPMSSRGAPSTAPV
jgi:aryl-alcohol dehydrogenase-like predicted oxidoreductase